MNIEKEVNVEKLREHEKELVTEYMPKFGRGIAEAAIERESVLWKDLEKVFLAHGIAPEIDVKLDSDAQHGADASHPVVVCGGVIVRLSYRVFPEDGLGRDGSLPADVLEQIGSVRKRIAVLEGQ